MTPPCFALLDDGGAAGDGRAASAARLYTGLVRDVVCHDPANLDQACGDIEQAVAAGLHAVVLADYEFGVRLHGVRPVDMPATQPGTFRCLLFDTLRRLGAEEVDAWLHRGEVADSAGTAQPAPLPAITNPPGAAGICELRASVTQEAFAAAIDRIHDWLRSGECYQINYTYRYRFSAFGSPFALYRRLRVRQPVPYGALIALPAAPGDAAGPVILSLSPELFVRHDAGTLTAQPMKGTAAASGDPAVDRQRAEALAADSKNRAENLMIVDLLRNDLGRLAQPGSVRVPALFEVRRFAGVLQMTSTVTARPRPESCLADVLRALFPCGSITGAPKHRTMQLIDTLETAPRGLYTGAIGWLDKPQAGQALGGFCLSVAIRTICLAPPHLPDGLRAGQLGVGAGIVLDSEAQSEWDECLLKARFLTGMDPGFALLETMFATAVAGVRHLALHLSRLRASASYFGFRFDEAALSTALAQACNALPPDTPCRLRLALHHDGRVELTHGVLAPLTTPVAVMLDDGPPLDPDDIFLRHKTTLRERYDAAWRDAEAHGAFDKLFFNRRDELAEGARSSVFVKRGGRWLTPPLASGVLPGVMRQVILNDPAWQADEAVLKREDLSQAEAVVVCNALRGALPARLI